MRAALARSLTALCMIAAALAAALGLLGSVGPAIASLALSIGLLGALVVRSSSALRAELRTARTAQRASYERGRETLEALARIADQQRATDEALFALADDVALDDAVERSRDLEAIAPAIGDRVLLIGGPPTGVEVDGVDHVLLGRGMLERERHGMHQHVLISATELRFAGDDDGRWLARALRWRLVTVLAPAREASLLRALLPVIIGEGVELVDRGRLLELRGPAAPPVGWGSA